MSANALDRLNAQYDEDVRRVIADLIGSGGTRQQVVDLLTARYDFSVTTRTVTNWMANDDGLVEMLEAQRVARQALEGDDDAPPPRNRAQDDADLFTASIEHPAFAALLMREPDRPDAGEVGHEFAAAAPAAADDDVIDPDLAAVLEGIPYDSPDGFEAAALARLTDDERASIEHLLAPA